MPVALDIDEIMGAYPIRPWQSCKVDAGFLDAGYYRAFRRWHKGVDINLKSGGDSDLGYPVQNMFAGKVVFAERVVGSWGGIVLVRAGSVSVQHAADMTGIVMDVLDVQYAHLHHVTVKTSDIVRAGDHVGSIGKGTRNQYTAHLHLEMRRTIRPAAEGQGGDDEAKRIAKVHYLDPLAMMTAIKLSNYGREEMS